MATIKTTKAQILAFFLVFGIIYPATFWVFLDGASLIRRVVLA